MIKNCIPNIIKIVDFFLKLRTRVKIFLWNYRIEISSYLRKKKIIKSYQSNVLGMYKRMNKYIYNMYDEYIKKKKNLF